MVPIDTPGKRARFLVIAFILLTFTVSSASAATPASAKATASQRKTTVKTQVKGEKITANSISVVGNNTISTYTVKNGDTLSGIAQKFDISVNTIRWSNNIDSNDTIKPGETLTILPTSGVVYTVKSGDTLSGIAVKFNADQNDILNANDLADANSLKIGMKLVIPEAEPLDVAASSSAVQDPTAPLESITPIPLPTQTPETAPTAIQLPVTDIPNNVPGSVQTPGATVMVTNPVTTETYDITVTSPAGSSTYSIPPYDIRGYYAQPVSGRLSQGLHPVNAVDIATPIGTTVHAAADGTVIVAMGNGKYNGGYGNYIVISHPNGTQTLYAHLSKVTVSLGEMVTQGEPIALSGNSGDSTGPHLHFEVRGAVNPWTSDKLDTVYTI